MSETDSFIEEVSEEVRRDRLFALMKKYGWIVILLVLLLVGGAAYNEFRKSQERSAAQALGDSVISALRLEDAGERMAALKDIDTQSGSAAGVLALLVAGEAVKDEDPAGAIAALKTIANDAETAPVYRHLAELKLILAQGEDLAPQERIDRLTALSGAGAPYRLQAEEQIAVAEVALGQTDAALKRLMLLLEDGEASPALRRRVSQLIVALGGQLEPA
ncbi:MAG: tetratricopeptide repeat protein [Marinosulfonomonas sp.]|nr:tetratricopeptide repeat protein [Marinosulfonomonas sp.]